MKLLILGGTGPTGRHLADLAALRRLGHGPRTQPGSPRRSGGPDHRRRGDATSQRDVSAAVLGQDAIISALGQGRSLNHHALFDRASATVIGAAKATGAG
ncbi:NAD(P)H-binding protein [Streptomyces sp. Inha503]|uniref:NAD(P)H-binding protein n=1 Tax=Streptomyces sp. Inha503 TaxID=3383314 RepID=UPI0039A24D1E